MSWKCVRRIALAIALVCVVGVLGYLGYWLPRYNCLCFKAHVYPGEHLPIDSQIRAAVSFEPDRETWHLCVLTCPHGRVLQATVFDDYYTIQEKK